MFLTLTKYSRFDEILHVVRHGQLDRPNKKDYPLEGVDVVYVH